MITDTVTATFAHNVTLIPGAVDADPTITIDRDGTLTIGTRSDAADIADRIMDSVLCDTGITDGTETWEMTTRDGRVYIAMRIALLMTF